MFALQSPAYNGQGLLHLSIVVCLLHVETFLRGAHPLGRHLRQHNGDDLHADRLFWRIYTRIRLNSSNI